MKLYEIAAQYENVLQQAFNVDTGEVSEFAISQLNEITTDVKQKGLAVAAYIQNLEAEEIAVDAAIDRMIKRRNRLIARSKFLVDYLQSNMERTGITEISCPDFEVKLKKCPLSVDVIDEDDIPQEYKKSKQVITLDKLKIKQELQAGVVIPGVTLKQNTRLEIK